jgi:hypothetical protein
MEKNPQQDANEMAFQIVQKATQDETQGKGLISKIMAEMGRKGGKKGGLARALALTPEKRRKIAKNAAKKRWEKGPAKS